MIDYEGMLKEFHVKFYHHRELGPAIPKDMEVHDLRYKLINEEVNDELLVALDALKHAAFSESQNEELQIKLLVELADALADSIYVIVGTAISFGIPINKVFAEVHRSNMTKSMLKDSKSIKGKTLKGDKFEPPKIREILEEAAWKSE